MSRVKLLQQFLGHVFTENCRCFQGSCDIQVTNKEVKFLIHLFRDAQNRKNCITFFDRHRLDFGKMLKNYLVAMVSLGLLVKGGSHYMLTDGAVFTWKNVQRPHNVEGCFCDNIQKLRPDLDEFIKEVKGRNCKYLRQCPHLTGEHLHEFTRCIFWYFRKAFVDNLIQFCYSSNAIRPSYASSSQQLGTARHSTSIFEESSRYSLNRFKSILGNSDVSKDSIDDLLDLDPKEEFGASKSSCQAISVGSMRLSSDYDVTMYGTCVSKVIRDFNQIFRGIFSASSATIFDTNIYGSSFIETTDASDFNSSSSKFYAEIDCSTDKVNSEPYFYVMSLSEVADAVLQGQLYETEVGDLKSSMIRQHLWALVKLLKSCRHEVLKTQKSGSILNLLMETKETPLKTLYNHILGILLVIGGLRYLDYKLHSSTGQNVDQLDPSELLVGSIESEELWNIYNNFNQEHAESQALAVHISPTLEVPRQNNRMLSRLRNQSMQFAPTQSALFAEEEEDATPVDYADLPFEFVRRSKRYSTLLDTVSIFNFFGAETYYTRGAFMHVVFSLQTCKGMFNGLSEHDYWDSFIENFGDCIHHDFKSKYIDRMYSALNTLHTQYGRKGHKNTLQILKRLTNGHGHEMSEKEKWDFVLSCFTSIGTMMYGWFAGQDLGKHALSTITQLNDIVAEVKRYEKQM